MVQFRFILQDQLQILTPGNRNTITASQTAEQVNTQHPSVKGEDKDYGWTLISSPHSVLLHSILTPSVSPPHQGGGDITEGSDQFSLSPSWGSLHRPRRLLLAVAAPQLTLLLVNTVLWSLLLAPTVRVTISHIAKVA